MSRFRCFDTYNLTQSTSSDRTTDVKRKTIFTEYQTIAIGNVNFQKGLTEGVIPPGYLRKDNGAYYYGPVYVTTDDPGVNNCLIGAKNYELLYDVLFGAQPSPDEITNAVVSYDGAAWQGNILKTNFKDISNGLIGPAVSNVPDGSANKMNYQARQDFIPKYNDVYGSPPNDFPGIIIDPCYNIFYPRCSTSEQGNNYIKNVTFNFSSAELKNSEIANYLRLSSARKFSKFPYQLNFQTTTCEKYPFTFIFSFTNNSTTENAEDILLKYMPIINVDNSISYTIEYTVGGQGNKELTYYIRFKYTGTPSDVDGFTFYPLNTTSPLVTSLLDPTLVDFYNTYTTNLTIQKFDLMPLSPLGYQFNDLSGIIFSGTDVPIIKPGTSFKSAFEETVITLNGDGISKWRTSGVVDMNSTFKNSNFNGNINEWNISNVRDIRSLFEGNTSFNEPINNWVFSKEITDMSRMFYGATAFNQSINTWDTSNIVNMRNLFTGASTFDQSLNLWNTSLVRDMSGIFMNATSFNGDIRIWSTSSVLTMHSMFKNATSFNGNIQYDSINNYWNTFNVETFESIFQDTIAFNNSEIPLPSIDAGRTKPLNWVNLYDFTPNITNPNTSNIILNSTLNADGLTRENAFPFFNSSILEYTFYDNSGTSSADIIDKYLPIIIDGSSYITDVVIDPSSATIGYRTVSFSLVYNSSDANTGLSFYDPSNTKVDFYNSVGAGNPITILNFIQLAKNGNQFSKLLNLEISSLFSPIIFPNTSLDNAFSETNFIDGSSNLSSWDVTNVINMSNMFRDSSFNQDISGWITSNVTDMSYMFENNKLFNQDLSKWNTSNVTDMSYMFKNAEVFNSKLQYDPSSNPSSPYWNVSNVLNMTSMFEGASLFNDGQGPDETTQPLNWILNPLVILTNVRTGATNLTNQNAFPLPSFYTLIYEFYNDPPKLDQDISTNIPILISGPSTTSTIITNSSLSNYRTVSVTLEMPNHIPDTTSGLSFINVKQFFNDNSGNPHIITQFDDIPLARNDSSGNDGYQFANLSCKIDFSANDVPSILPNTTLSYCFYNNSLFDSSLNWDTTNATSMESMFKNATTFNKQISYTGGPYWNVSNVINMISIFENASTFNNGFAPGDTAHPLNWILNLNVNATNCIKNATNLTYQNAFPLADIVDRFTYTFYNTQNFTTTDISNLYLPIIKTSDINLSYYYPPNITINALDNSFTTVTVYYRYNDVCSNVIDGLSFSDVSSAYNQNLLAKTISRFGNIPLAKNDGTTQGNQFSNINNLVFNSSTVPTIVYGTTFENIFNNSTFNSSINNWDISGVTSLNKAFANTSFNQPLNNWDTINVTDMSGTFYNNPSFNQDISGWYVGNVTTMEGMFYNNTSFNQPIGNWDISNVTTMKEMFYNCHQFNQNLSTWNTNNVVTFELLFYNSTNFNNGDIVGASTNPLVWNTSNVTNLSGTFYGATSFNQDISGWNTGNVTTMENLFRETDNFNGQIGRWDVSNVTNMQSLFYDAIAFNQDISEWDTGNVTTMENMFRNAIVFNKQISYSSGISLTDWDTSEVLSMISIFEGALLFNNGSAANIDDTSLNWILNPNVNISKALINTPSLTADNALPLSKEIIGNFTYTFHNNTTATDEDISNNYIPIIINGNSFENISYNISHPFLSVDPSFTKIDISFSYLDVGNLEDGLSFYDPSNSKVNFYNSTLDRLTIVQFGGIPISRTNGNNDGYQFANLFYLDISLNHSLDEPTILTDTSFNYAFYNTPSFNSGNIQNWETVFVKSMNSMFEDSSFNQPLRFNTRNVTNMNSMFKNATNFNKNISYQSSSGVNVWNTSNVIDMGDMFNGTTDFNNGQSEGETTQPLNWILNPNVDISFVRINTPNLTNQNAFPLPSIYTLKYDFYDNSGVSGEFISNNYIPIILNGKSMLYNITITPSGEIVGNKSARIELAYVPDISNTGLSFYSSDNKITDFYNNNNNYPLIITQFDDIPLARNDSSGNDGYQFANLNLIDFSSNDVPIILPNTTLSYCFFNCSQFNSDISDWNTSEVTSMASMFEGDTSFNKSLQTWNTSNVTNMEKMFKNSASFNQTIKYNPSLNYWDISGVTNMISIFEGAINFNNGFPQFNADNSLNWILNGGVDITNSVTNTPNLTDFNGLPLTTSIYYPNLFSYKFYNINGVSIENILLNYLPFVKINGDLVFDINKNVYVQVIPGPSSETIIQVRFSFTDDGITNDGLSFNSDTLTCYFYNQTQNPVEIIQFGGMPLSRYYSFWETVNGNTFNSFGYAVENGNNEWVSVGGTLTNTILRSSNGTTWNDVSGTVFGGIGYGISYGGGTWIAVGDDYGGLNSILRSIDNGITWSDVSGTIFSYAGYAVAYDVSGRWVAVGDNNGGPNTILTSTDSGLNWISTTGSFSVAGFGVSYGMGRWVAVGAGTNSILTSTDGITWSTVTGTQFNSYGQSVIYDGSGRWVAIGHDNGGLNTILTSTDGLNWSDVSGTKFSSYGQGLAYGNGRWIAVGYDNGGSNTILTSIDGQNWSPVTSNFAFAGYSVSYNSFNGRWVAVGDNNENLNTILTSVNGIKWIPVKGTRFNLTGYGIANNNNDEWVAVGYDTLPSNSILYNLIS